MPNVFFPPLARRLWQFIRRTPLVGVEAAREKLLRALEAGRDPTVGSTLGLK
jgi:hypothetical protein